MELVVIMVSLLNPCQCTIFAAQQWMSIVYFILGILGFVYTFHTYPHLINDARLDAAPFYNILAISIMTLPLLAINAIEDQSRYNRKVAKAIVYPTILGLAGCWIWTWVIVASRNTWSILQKEYNSIWALNIVHLVAFLALGMLVLEGYLRPYEEPKLLDDVDEV